MSIDNYKELNDVCGDLTKILDPYKKDYSLTMSFGKMKSAELELIMTADGLKSKQRAEKIVGGSDVNAENAGKIFIYG